MKYISIKHKEKIRLSIDFMITCYIYSGSLHIRSYCVRSPWYWISVTRLVFYLYCVNFVIYWKYCVSDILRLHMTFMTLGSFCLVVKMKIFTVIHILTQENWKKVYIFLIIVCITDCKTHKMTSHLKSSLSITSRKRIQNSQMTFMKDSQMFKCIVKSLSMTM